MNGMVALMKGFEMEYGTQEIIGNPVDMWWNKTRQHIDIHIVLLRNISSAFDIELAAEELEQTYLYLIDEPFPNKSAETRAYLLRSVEHLRSTLVAIKDQDRMGIIEGYNMAYNRYISVCRLLLDRGIFEPVPSRRNSQRQ
jgi:hypothetical protein